MEQIHDRVAGLDVHRDTVAVCVRTPGPRGGVNTEKARFDTTAGGLAGLAHWLAERGVALAAMEATGVYWKPVYYALEGRFELWLCNAHHVKNVPGRKTDMSDAEWLATWPRTGWCGQLRAAAGDPGAAGADALPQDPDRRPGRGDRTAGEGAPGRRDQADLGGLQGADPVGAGDHRGADRRAA